MDQALNLAGPDQAGVQITGFERDPALGAGYQGLDVGEDRSFAQRDFDHLVRHAVLGDASAILELAEDEVGAALVIVDQELLHILVDRRLDRGAEAGAHIDAFRAQRQRGGEAAAVAKATAGDHRDAELVGRRRDQDEAGNIVLAGMAGAFETVDRDGIDAHPLGREGMADGGAFMDDDDAMRLEIIDMFLRLVAGGLDDLDAAVDDRLAILRIGRRIDRGQDGEVHAQGLVRHRPAAVDLAAQIVRRRLGQGGKDAQAPGIGDGGGQFGAADPHHAALHDRMFDAAQFGETRLQSHHSASTIVTLAMPPPSHMVCRP